MSKAAEVPQSQLVTRMSASRVLALSFPNHIQLLGVLINISLHTSDLGRPCLVDTRVVSLDSA